MGYQEFLISIKDILLIVHLAGVFIGMGSALFSDLLFTFFTHDKILTEREIKILSRLANCVLWGLTIIILSGLLLFVTDMERYLGSVKFMGKMTILFVLLFNGYFLNHYVWQHLMAPDFFVSPEERTSRKVAFASGTISVISWIFICTLGFLKSVSVSYPGLIGIYISFLLVSIPISLLIERIEFD